MLLLFIDLDSKDMLKAWNLVNTSNSHYYDDGTDA